MTELTKEEKSLLLYFETRATDYGGTVDGANMNGADFSKAQEWDKAGFVKFGRICSEDLDSRRRGAYWCRLSSDAVAIAHQLRAERADRVWEKRRWRTTEEYRGGK